MQSDSTRGESQYPKHTTPGGRFRPYSDDVSSNNCGGDIASRRRNSRLADVLGAVPATSISPTLNDLETKTGPWLFGTAGDTSTELSQSASRAQASRIPRNGKVLGSRPESAAGKVLGRAGNEYLPCGFDSQDSDQSISDPSTSALASGKSVMACSGQYIARAHSAFV